MAKPIKSALVFAVLLIVLLATEVQRAKGSYCQKELPSDQVSCSEAAEKCYAACESLGYEDGACLPVHTSGETCVCISGACPSKSII